MAKVFLQIIVFIILSSYILISQNSKTTGTYYFNNNEVEIRITITGNFWRGVTKIKDVWGDGSVSYERGLIKNNNLYDESGYAQIGYCNGKSIVTTIGNGSRVTLYKK